MNPAAVCKSRFDRDGYVRVESFLPVGQVEQCNREVDRYIRELVPTLPPEHVFYEDRENRSSLKQLQKMHEHDDWFRELAQGKPQALAESLLGTEVEAVNLQFFNKPPGIGKPTPPHQDGYFFKLNPPLAVTMWMALEAVDLENGCIHYVKGSHKTGMRAHRSTGTLGFSQGIYDYGTELDCENEVAQPAEPGDLLAHHALTIHHATGNDSPSRSRRALGFIFYSLEAQPDEEALAEHRRLLAAQQQGQL